ncbi:TadE/TadG family type IV pilus assembly protein [Streptomyces sp. NPDC050534]|uniref:TadE/TadG family type IV pilus assembly protein n=1 Tax=Streptomyces sp. NPDC050534 TaxID=3365625 RepID=UPI00378E6D15
MSYGRKSRDRGQVALEYLGFLPILLIVAMAAVQLGIIAYVAQQAGTAARAGARSASLQQGSEQACRDAVSGWVDVRSCPASAGPDEVTVTATVHIPSVFPGYDGFGDAHKKATMPLDH